MQQESRRRLLVPIAVFVLLMLGCSAADLVQRQRDEATPSPAASEVALLPTFTATAIPVLQTVVIVTPPTTDQPGVIIIPPGMDPNSVVPILPTATPTLAPTNAQTPTIQATQTIVVVVPPSSNPVSLLPTPTPSLAGQPLT